MGSIGRKDKTKGKALLKPDGRLREACGELRHWVEHFNKVPSIALRGERYGPLDPTKIYTTRVENVEIGYKLEEILPLLVEMDQLPTMRRTVYVKLHDYKFAEVPKEDRDTIISAVLDAFMDQQQTIPDMDINRDGDVMKLTQDFKVAVMYQRNPNLVTIAGGLG
jgi:hypothetical protein